MGQYWKPVNLDKKEYIHPHSLGAGLKLWEQLANHPGTAAALILLCAAHPYSRGGGDLGDNPYYHGDAELTDDSIIIGRWAGDRIALVGDYAEDGDLPEEFQASTIYGECEEGGKYKDITEMVAAVLLEQLGGQFTGNGWKSYER